MGAPTLIGYWVVKAGVWVFLIWKCASLGLHRRYPITFTYIFSAIFLELAVHTIAATVGADSQLYTGVYLVAYLAVFGLASAVVLSIYRVFGSLKRWAHLHLVAGPVVLGTLTLLDPTPAPILHRVIGLAATVLFYWCVATVFRMLMQREWDLGWNLKLTLLSISLPFGFNSLVVTASYAGIEIPYETANWWIKAGALTSWVSMAVGMSDYSPPRLLTVSAAWDRHRPPKSGHETGNGGSAGQSSICEKPAYVTTKSLK